MARKGREMTQNEQVLSYIERNGSITTWEAIQNFRITRLSRCIGDLKEDGHDIISTPFTENGKTFARYSLKKEFAESLF